MSQDRRSGQATHTRDQQSSAGRRALAPQPVPIPPAPNLPTAENLEKDWARILRTGSSARGINKMMLEPGHQGQTLLNNSHEL